MMMDKTYLVSVSGGRSGYAPTLAEAKKLGAKIARLTERNDTKWNVSYVVVGISKADGPGYYRSTGWRMLVPVRGTGARRETIVAAIKRRFGVPPYRWFKR